MVQIAVHDALNVVRPRYARYTGLGLADLPRLTRCGGRGGGARDHAGAAGPGARLAGEAGRHRHHRGRVHRDRRAGADTDAATQAGIDAGGAAAEAILALRAADGSATPHRPYTLLPAPGVYQPTPNPEFPDVITPSFAGLVAAGRQTCSPCDTALEFEVEPGAIFDLTSEEYAREYNEVKQKGDARVRGALPDSEESDIARFWPGGGSNWNLTARVIVSGRGLDRWQHARLFALLNMAQADALIANQYWKYTYHFWRPVTAIRWADDGNPDTVSDPVWRPFLVTPPYPDYPCALPDGQRRQRRGAAPVLRQRQDRRTFTRDFDGADRPAAYAACDRRLAKPITRSFHTLSQAIAEARDARVYAGIHFREGCEAGARQGAKIARFVVQHELRPLKGKRGKRMRRATAARRRCRRAG